MNSDVTAPRDDVYNGRAIVAAFPDRASAEDAVDRLRLDNFQGIWMGVTSANHDAPAPGERPAQGRVDRDDDSVGARIGRFFSRENDGRGLYHALRRHGVAETEARRIDRAIPADAVILTVDGQNHPELAAEIIEDAGGHIVAGESFAGGTAHGAYDGTLDEGRFGSRILGYGDAQSNARGIPIDAERRMQLRSERLNVAKERVVDGIAEVRKDVVETRASVDVPVIHEELFIERRAASADAIADEVAPIGEGETIRIPLTREQVRVTKRPVVTEEVVVGKRSISELQRIDETVREEKLFVDDGR